MQDAPIEPETHCSGRHGAGAVSLTQSDDQSGVKTSRGETLPLACGPPYRGPTTNPGKPRSLTCRGIKTHYAFLASFSSSCHCRGGLAALSGVGTVVVGRWNSSVASGCTQGKGARSALGCARICTVGEARRRKVCTRARVLRVWGVADSTGYDGASLHSLASAVLCTSPSCTAHPGRYFPVDKRAAAGCGSNNSLN